MALLKPFQPFAVIHDLKRTIIAIREQWRGTRRENKQLRRELEQMRQERAQLERERERLREENEQLKRQLEEAQRPASDKPPRFPDAPGARSRGARDASLASPMARVTANAFPTALMR